MNDARGRDAEVQCGVMWPGMQDVVASDHTTQTTQVPHRLLPHLLPSYDSGLLVLLQDTTDFISSESSADLASF